MQMAYSEEELESAHLEVLANADVVPKVLNEKILNQKILFIMVI